MTGKCVKGRDPIGEAVSPLGTGREEERERERKKERDIERVSEKKPDTTEGKLIHGNKNKKQRNIIYKRGIGRKKLSGKKGKKSEGRPREDHQCIKHGEDLEGSVQIV